MKKPIIFSVTSIFLFVFFFQHSVRGQDVCKRAEKLLQRINTYHLEPRPTNDSLSERVFERFIHSIDGDQIFLTKNDSIQISKFYHEIDNEILAGHCSIIPATTGLLNQKVRRIQVFSDSILQRPLHYSKSEMFYSLRPKRTDAFSKSDVELKDRLLQELKFKVLIKAWRMAQLKNEKLSIGDFPSLEKQAREKVKTTFHHKMESLLHPPQGFETFVGDLFMKAICLSFDPHSEFFTADEMKGFEKSLSTSGLSYGLTLQENQTGEVQVSNLLPGGPAWKSMEVKSGDVLISVTFDKGSPLDISDYEVEEIHSMMERMESLQATFTLRKADGRTQNVLLKKEKIENTENLISSFVLENTKKVGYIALPGFYTNEEDLAGKGCAADVAKELIKLKRDGIEGLILDLRFNGGGSVREAIELMGIFIDAGPLALLEERGEKFIALKDMNRGSAYNGPVVILINTFSASASELVAAGLQDYNRAIIVGGVSFGKATGQVVFPMESAEEGFVKITTDRIYRVNGTSLQTDGVTPDIKLPELSDILSEKERVLCYSIPSKKISKKINFAPLPSIPLDMIRTGSGKRINDSPYFNGVIKFSRLLQQPLPLDTQGFINYMNGLEALSDSLEFASDTTQYKVYSSNLNQSLLAVDAYHREINDALTGEIKKSRYIGEAYKIIVDYIKSSKTTP